MTTQFVNVASLVPDQRHCNLRLRVLSVETIAETIHPETGKVIQSAEAIVGDNTACVLLNLKNDQVNFLANNARLQVLNGHVNMYRGFMRLEVNEEEGGDGSDTQGRGKPSITAILDEDEDGLDSQLSRDGDKMFVTTTPSTTGNIPIGGLPTQGESSHAGGATTTLAAASSSIPTATISSELSSNSLASGASTSSILSRDQLDMEMRLGTGGSVPLMEYYRTIEFTYFSTVEPVGR
ncbi:hypothetical protein EDD21DRAFT_349250 [Dissophora ornata]|nr:hypothetical protein BGZ58_008990 [Dissophora ornata]KAI8606249.1 hypothetical protein EDD21DRAFT_349250 [Dissophora ornata]